jgi:hypothetical protein
MTQPHMESTFHIQGVAGNIPSHGDARNKRCVDNFLGFAQTG